MRGTVFEVCSSIEGKLFDFLFVFICLVFSNFIYLRPTFDKNCKK